MNKLVLGTLVAAGLVSAACSTSNPAGQPTVSFTSPLAAGPANGASYKFKAQPVTLQITNAVRASSIPAIYTIEVASDSAFNNKVFTQDNIAEGSGGTTSVTVTNLLATSGNVTYYWRSFATVDGVAGPMSATQTFVVQQQIVVSSPELSGPDSGITSVEPRVTLTTKNASRVGAVGAITYTFQLSTTSAFSNPTTATVAEGSGGQTSWTPPGDLAAGTYFWRVQARDDANTEISAFSSARSFIVEPFDPTKAVFHNNFSDIGSWPQTAKITSVEFNRSGMIVEFDRRTGSNKWPEVGSPDGFGPLQYTLGLCYKISGTWHCSAPIQFWDGRDLAESGPWDQIPDNWYYDSARWGPMAGYRPERGELVMVWAGQGNLRGFSGGTQVQRTNFAPVRWGEPYEAK